MKSAQNTSVSDLLNPLNRTGKQPSQPPPHHPSEAASHHLAGIPKPYLRITISEPTLNFAPSNLHPKTTRAFASPSSHPSFAPLRSFRRTSHHHLRILCFRILVPCSVNHPNLPSFTLFTFASSVSHHFSRTRPAPYWKTNLPPELTFVTFKPTPMRPMNQPFHFRIPFDSHHFSQPSLSHLSVSHHHTQIASMNILSLHLHRNNPFPFLFLLLISKSVNPPSNSLTKTSIFFFSFSSN